MKKFLEPMRIFSFLSLRESFAVCCSLILRVLLVSLDLAGLLLIGLTVSKITNTNLDRDSFSGKVVALVESELGAESSLIFAVSAVMFFVFKALLSIYVNKKIFFLFTKIETRQVSKVFRFIAVSELTYISKLHKKDFSFNLLDSFDYAIGKQLTALSIIFGEVFLIAGVFIYLLILDLQLTISTLLFFGLVVYAMNQMVARRTKNASRNLRISASVANEASINLFENFKQLKVQEKQDIFVDRFILHRKLYAESNSEISQTSVLPRYITEISLVVGFALLLTFQDGNYGEITSPNVIAIFVAGCFRIVASLLPLQGSLGVLMQVREFSRPAVIFMEELRNHTTREEKPRKHQSASPWGIRVNNLGFKFSENEEWQFNKIDLHVPSGSVLVIKGKSGAGKSTLAELLLGLRLPSQGTIRFVDGSNQELEPSQCGQVGYVPQETTIFTGSVTENISLESAVNSSLDRVTNAAIAAGLLSKIESLRDSFETIIGPANTGLSGGEQQRIGIARALYGEPRLLVLDESTSALDKKTSSELHKVLEKLKGKITIIAISHDDEFDLYADQIINLD